MRVVTVFILVGAVFCDDKSFCQKKCSSNYATNESTTKLQSACLSGCDSRGSPSDGPFSFVGCHQKCDSLFKDAINEKKACQYACSLPMTSSVFMSFDYSHGDKPIIKVVRHEGDDVQTSFEDSPLGKILGDFNQHFTLRAPSIYSDDSDDLFGFRNSNVGFGQFEMDKVRQRLNQLMESFSQQFFDGIRKQMQRQQHIITERPNGHSGVAMIGPQVGNLLTDGRSIVVAHPLQTESTNNRRGLAVFHWVLIAFGVGALLLTLVAAIVFLRAMRSTAYRRMTNQGMFGRRPPPAPGPVPIKKVPLEGWVEHSEPAGVPPPAYDQVSIHSLKKQPSDSESSTSGADSPSPDHEKH